VEKFNAEILISDASSGQAGIPVGSGQWLVRQYSRWKRRIDFDPF
jgi:hypothetical protein